ncbi:Uncharacterized protein QTN25_001160 [Entamoeba marina]
MEPQPFCKDCHRSDIHVKPFRTDFICRECFVLLHFKRFRLHLNNALKKKGKLLVIIIKDESMTSKYLSHLINLFIEEDANRKRSCYDISVLELPQDEINEVPTFMLERIMCWKAKQVDDRHVVWIDGSNITTKAANVLSAVCSGDVLTVPSISHYIYEFQQYHLTVIRPVEFTEKEVMEYMDTLTKEERKTDKSIESHCQHFMDSLEENYSQAPHTVISTSQKVQEVTNSSRCIGCCKPFQPFLNDCGDGYCRTCSAHIEKVLGIVEKYPLDK